MMDKKKFFDKITDKKEFLNITKKLGLKIDSLFEGHDKQYEIILRKAEKKELDAKYYVKMIEEYIKGIEKYFLHFKDEEDLFGTIRAMDIDSKNSKKNIKHEKQHLKKIRKYGLTPSFMIMSDSEKLYFIPAVGFDLEELGEKTGWDLKKIIEVEIDIGNVEDKSDGDIKRIEFLGKLLSEIR